MRLLLAVITFLIIYGSLYPFTIEPNSYSPVLLENLLDFDLTNSGRGDIVANILLFIPFGLLGINVFPGRSLLFRLALVLSASFILAFVIQVAQLVIPGRVPAGTDSIWNLIGSAIGCVVGLTPVSQALQKLNGSKSPPEIPIILALLWLLFGLAPFIPSLDLQLIKNNLKIVINDAPSAIWIFQSLTMWLVVFYFLRRSSNRLVTEKHYPVIVAFTLAAGFMIVGHTVSSEKLIGGIFAIPIWLLFKRHFRPSWLAVALTIVIIGTNHTPFELRDSAANFNWIPFSGALTSNLLINVLATFKKIVLYGSLIWLLIECRMPMRFATGITATLLFISEYLQQFYVNTTPEITDPVLALGIGVAFFQYLKNTEKFELKAANDHLEKVEYKTTSSLNAAQKPDRSHQEVSASYLPGMDGLRAIAALAVFFVHFNQQVGLQAKFGAFDLERLLSNGNTGVALFFVLSGLLLSLPFWQAQLGQKPPPNLRGYAWRRAGRIIPAYYFCLFIILLAKSIGGSGTSWNNIISHLLFVYNISDYNILSLNQPFWTLAVEAQFYAFLPLLFLGLQKIKASTATIVVILLIPALYFLNFWIVGTILNNANFPVRQTLIWPFALYLSGPKSFVLTYSTLGHLPHFLIGVLSARIVLHLLAANTSLPPFKKWFDVIICLATFAVLIILSTPIDDVLQIPKGRYNFPFVPLLLAAIVISVPFSQYFRRMLSWRVIAWLGAISYGIYIFHYPVQKLLVKGMVWINYPVSEHALVFALASFAITLAISQLSYILIEIPALGWVRNRLTPRKTTNTEQNTAELFDQSPDLHKTAFKSESLQQTQSNARNAISQHSGLIPEKNHDLQLNLHKYQYDYLKQLTRRTNLDFSKACSEIIAHSAHSTLASAKSSPSINTELLDITLQSGNLDWTKTNITLDTISWKDLSELANHSQKSHSHTLRRLLEKHIKRPHDSIVQSKKSAWSGNSLQSLTSRHWIIMAICSLLAVGTWLLTSESEKSAFIVSPAWAGNNASLIFDHHTHTVYSDGELTPSELVKLGVENGCDVMAITDHSIKAGSASAEQITDIKILRRQYPDLLLFSGIELNMPSYAGREHVNVIVEPEFESKVLRKLGDVAENSISEAADKEGVTASDASTLSLIRQFISQDVGLIVTYNHPSRKVKDVNESMKDIQRWDGSNEIFTAIEGAPGHQKAENIGSYKYTISTEDRWDPTVSKIGGVWDQLLEKGHNIWGAIASSDYHNKHLDMAPCSYSRIHLASSDKSYSGVLNSMKAGTFWADHGNILKQLYFSLEFETLIKPAFPGSIVKISSNEESAVISISIKRGQGSIDSPLTTEVISNCKTGKPEIVFNSTFSSEQNEVVGLVPILKAGVDAESCYFRARVRLFLADQPDLLAYTNPIRILF